MLVVTPLLVRRQRGRLVCNNLVLRQDSTDHKARPLGQAVYVSKRVVRVKKTVWWGAAALAAAFAGGQTVSTEQLRHRGY